MSVLNYLSMWQFFPITGLPVSSERTPWYGETKTGLERPRAISKLRTGLNGPKPQPLIMIMMMMIMMTTTTTFVFS